MSKRFYFVALAAPVIIAVALFGCKAKVEAPSDEARVEAVAADTLPQSDAMLAAQTQAAQTVIEPASTVATETIPPTAAVQQAASKIPAAITSPATDRIKDIQTALKNSGFYAGSVDGKVGPKTKTAIMEFQKAKGLKADGKVGPKTWAELEKYLIKQ